MAAQRVLMGERGGASVPSQINIFFALHIFFDEFEGIVFEAFGASAKKPTKSFKF